MTDFIYFILISFRVIRYKKGGVCGTVRITTETKL